MYPVGGSMERDQSDDTLWQYGSGGGGQFRLLKRWSNGSAVLDLVFCKGEVGDGG